MSTSHYHKYLIIHHRNNNGNDSVLNSAFLQPNQEYVTGNIQYIVTVADLEDWTLTTTRAIRATSKTDACHCSNPPGIRRTTPLALAGKE